MHGEKRIDPDKIVKLFGLQSIYYKKINNQIEKIQDQKDSIFEKKFKQWKTIYSLIYYKDCTEDLFLKHCYYSTILYLIFIIETSKSRGNNSEQAYNDYISRKLENFSSKIFQTLNWITINKNIFQEIYDYLKDAQFNIEDLFHLFYQQVVESSIRHSAGEFYTHSNLVIKMVMESYKFGMKTLDPSCGSGNFIIEIFSKIIKSNRSKESKINSIKRIYAFDINPLAIYTLKINALIILNEFMPKMEIDKFTLNFYAIDSLFPEDKSKTLDVNLKELYNSFDLIIGNPPWLTYKDLNNKEYQKKIRNLAESLKIKPKSQYITHIELASIFFYAIPKIFSKINGIIFFVVTKSLINGDHCRKFRAFRIFDDLEIWDFPQNSSFNVNHICLKAQYIGNRNSEIIEKYPISTKIFDEKLNIIKKTEYSSLKIEDDGALLILPRKDIEFLSTPQDSEYKDSFYQGATLVPRTLVFFQIDEETNNSLIISSSEDILSRSKKKWRFTFENERIEKKFRFKTFLNQDMVPFFLKRQRNVFLPIDHADYKFKVDFLKKHKHAFKFYSDMNKIYKTRKKSTSDINTLFSNLNYWNKLTKQKDTALYLVVYNASGSYIKSAVIEQLNNRIIVGSENYYFSTILENEAYYLSAILNSPLLSKYIKLIKSSRHIHKRPFSFPIPKYDEDNKDHHKLAQKGKRYSSLVHEIMYKNPKFTSRKVRIVIHQNIQKLNSLTEKVVFN